MFRRLLGTSAAKLLLAALALHLAQTAGYGQQPCASCASGGCSVGGPAPCATCETCRAGCQRFHCPPALKWCMEGKPRICWQHGCPKPICNPCEAPNFGYFQKCWTPWPYPPDWSHCPVPPPASQVFPGMIPAQAGTGVMEEVGPNPRRLEARPPL